MKDLLIISGFDPSAGAGTLRDLLVATELGVSADFIITSLTVQNAYNFDSLYTVSYDYFRRSIEFLTGHKALKLSLITDLDLAKLLYKYLVSDLLWKGLKFKVLDPVLKASVSKNLFWNKEFMNFMFSKLIPTFDIITPNKREAKFIAGYLGLKWSNDKTLVQKLAEKLTVSVFMTGGDEDKVIDYLYDLENDEFFVRFAEKIKLDKNKTFLRHGTGCLYSTALVSFLLKGNTYIQAGINAAKMVEQKLYMS